VTLGRKQELFYRMNNEFDRWLLGHEGLEIRGGELYRPGEQAFLNSITCRVCQELEDQHDTLNHKFKPVGIANSNHCRKLASDKNIFIEGRWIRDSEELRWAGVEWKRRSTDQVTCCWGGDFSNPDGNHFSFEHEGVR